MIFTAPELTGTRGAELAHVPNAILLLAEKMKRIHGNVRIAREKTASTSTWRRRRASRSTDRSNS
jgi:hypothetical protein